MSVVRDSLGAIGLGAAVIAAMWIATTVVMGEPHLWALGRWRAVSVSDFTNHLVPLSAALVAGLAMGYWEANT